MSLDLSVSSIASSIFTAQPSAGSSTAGSTFRSLAQSLQSGDLAGAQTAFAALQTRYQASSAAAATSSGTSATSTSATDLQALGNALQSNDITGAQQAFAKLQQDGQQGAQHVHGGHHHHHGGGAPTATVQASTATDGTQPVSTTGIDTTA